MDRININNLFCTSNSKDNYKPLDVYSLYNPKKNLEKQELNFSIDKLINRKEEKKQKILVEYKKIFKMCLRKISSANKLDSIDIIYEVPVGIYRCYDFNSIECLEYLEEKLGKIHMDTLILSDRLIFISWSNIEENRNKSRNKEKQSIKK